MHSLLKRPKYFKNSNKRLVRWYLIVILLILFVYIYPDKNHETEAHIEGVQTTQQESVDIAEEMIMLEIRTRRAAQYEAEYKARQEAKQIVRILKGDLEGKEEVFLSSFSSKEIGYYVMSVICTESGCGKISCGTWNYSGIMKNGRCQNFESLEDYIENGIKKRTGSYFNRLEACGVSKECLNSIFIGQGRYCTSACTNWVSNFLFFYDKQTTSN